MAGGSGNAAQGTQQTSMRSLAQAVDGLERDIEQFGSVVVKQPDVWGQARLTKHRDEFEQQMSAELTNFQFTLQGSVAGADQAYFADAMALSAAASSQGATILSPLVGKSGGGTSTTTNTTAFLPGSLTTPTTLTDTQVTPSSGSKPQTITPIALPNQSGTFGAFNNITRNPATLPTPIGFAGSKGGISLEPTLYLDQKAQFLNHLHQLRRISEGDDTADSPGYALNLVRFPVSVLPGKRTDEGYGAEITMTLRPYISDELLPTTFRSLVLNDLVDQISFPIAGFINEPRNSVYLDARASSDVRDLFRLIENSKAYFKSPELLNVFIKEIKTLRWRPSLQPLFVGSEATRLDRVINELQEDEPRGGAGGTQEQRKYTSEQVQSHLKWVGQVVLLPGNTLFPQTKSRRAQMPFPPDQMLDIYGRESFYVLAKEAYTALSTASFSRPATDQTQIYIHLPDVQGYVQEKLAATYKLLEDPANIDLWTSFCTQELADAIRNVRTDDIRTGAGFVPR